MVKCLVRNKLYRKSLCKSTIMAATPTKSDLNISSLTPIRFLCSPPSQHDSQGIRSRLREIVKNLQENQKKWEAAQKRGLSLCMSIEAVKTRALVSGGGELYPKELSPYCEKLKIILSIFEDILANAKTILKQIQAIATLSRNSEEIIFRTWSVKHYLRFVEKVVEAYEQEFEAKKLVTENIAHSKDRSELVLHTSVWEFPAYTEEDFLLKFLFVGMEIHLENR